MQFFSIDPPLNLKRGQVRFGACLSDSAGPRLNYLLSRSAATDLYGEWVACRVSYHAFVRPEARRHKVQPFGFDKPADMQDIDSAERAMHMYVVGFIDSVEEAFLNVVAGEIDRAGRR